MTPTHAIDEAQMRQLREDLLDSMDEELELELDDRWGAEAAANDGQAGDRIRYFREIFAFINSHPGVVYWNGRQIYDWFVAQQPPPE